MNNGPNSAFGKRILKYLNTLHDIYQPQKLFEVMADRERYNAYLKTLKIALQKKPQALILQTEGGSILLSMEAVRLGARSVVHCEPIDSLACLYEDLIVKNGFEGKIVIVRKPIVQLTSEDPVFTTLPDILICNNIDAGLLGAGLKDTLKHAWHSLLPDNAQVIPKRAVVQACPLELMNRKINGFDISEFNRYRWSLFYENVRLGQEPYLHLANPQTCLKFDFTKIPMLENQILAFQLNHNGQCNAVAFWFDLDFDDQHHLDMAPPTIAKSSWHQAVQYLDRPIESKKNDILRLSVGIASNGIRFSHPEMTVISPVSNLKPSIAQWHFSMLADSNRNDAYECAIAKAIRRNPSAQVLDIGTGTGLLAMMAARAGAKKITACEQITHMADVARHHVEKNGFGDQIHVVNKLSTGLKIPTDMHRRAALLISETVDHSLLGEGFLPSLMDARSRLMEDENITIIPSMATVFAMAIELRVNITEPFDLTQFNLFRQGHYEGIRLKDTQYRALTDPFKTFQFDFYNRSFEPQIKHFLIPATEDGICNAIAFWYHLHLDEETMISTAPDANTTAWKQAVIFLNQEFIVEKGILLPISGQHDLNRLQFYIEPMNYMLEGGQTLPQEIPEWFERLKKTETAISEDTQAVKSDILNEYPFLVKSTVEELIKNFTELGFDLQLFSDFIKQVYYPVIAPNIHNRIRNSCPERC